jgi:hypothetical protein
MGLPPRRENAKTDENPIVSPESWRLRAPLRADEQALAATVDRWRFYEDFVLCGTVTASR